MASDRIADTISLGSNKVISEIGEKIENLSTGTNLAKFKKSNLTISKKSDLIKKSNFENNKSSKTDFSTSK